MYTALRVFVVDCKVARYTRGASSTHRKYLSVEFEFHQKLQWERKLSNSHVIEQARLRE